MKHTCEEIARAELGEPVRRQGAELFYRAPWREDEDPSLKINTAKDAWGDFPAGLSGNYWDLAAQLAGCSPDNKSAVKTWLREHGLLNGTKPIMGKEIEAYDYVDERGEVLYQNVRYTEPKDFRQRRPDGNGGWVGNLKGVRRVPYNLPALMKATSVLFVEGEKDCATGTRLGFTTTTTGSSSSWRPEFAEYFRGKRVCIIADADESGRSHARRVANSIVPVAEAVRLIELPGAKDLSEWVERGGTRETLLEIIKAAPLRTDDNFADAGKQPAAEPEPVGILVSEVKSERVSWLWRGYVPLRTITVLDGDPGLGKSMLTLELAARGSRGELSGDAGGPWGSVVLSAEDSLCNTIRPRLEAAGADLDRILAVPYTPEREGQKTVSNIPVDIPAIEQAIVRVGARLVIVDVLTAYLPSETNSYRDQDVRLALAPLAQMADRMDVAVIVIRHLNKAPGGNPIYRGGGSIGIIGAARAGLLVARDPDEPSHVIVAQTKNNLGPPASSLRYSIESDAIGVPRIVWQGESTHSASSLLAATVGGEEERGALAEAKEFLVAELGDGKRPQKEIQAEAHKAGIADATIRRAKAALGVKSRKDGFTGKWCWDLPDGDFSAEGAHDACEGVHIPGNEHLRQNGGSTDLLTAEESGTSSKVLNNTTEMSIFGDDLSTLADENSVPEDTDALEI